MLVAFLDRLEIECTSSVSTFQSRFSCITPPVQQPEFCPSPPTFFSWSDSLDIAALYTLWLLIPIPSVDQLLLLSQTQQAAASSDCCSIRLFCPPGFDTDLLLPTWMMRCWARLHSLLAHSKSWSEGKDWLQRLAAQSRFRAPADRCAATIGLLPLHAPLPLFPHLSTSRLPAFLGRSWLSDEEINAGTKFINTHPSCPPGARVLDSHFMESLALYRQRSATRSPSHPRQVDTMIAKGHLTHLYVIVHEEVHWTFMRVDIPARLFEYSDSMYPSHLHAPPECVELLNWWLSSVLSTTIALNPAPLRFLADRQTDTHSCGIAVLTNVAHIALGAGFCSWTQHSAELLRMEWFLRLSDGILLQVCV